MPRKVISILAVGILALVGLTLALMAVASIILTFTSESGLPNDSLYEWSIWVASRAILLAILLAMLILAGVIGLWLPRKLWGRINRETKPLPEKIIHRLNPDA